MTKQELKERKDFCQQNKLCFISKQSYEGQRIIALAKHSDAGLVIVKKEFEKVIETQTK